MIVNKRHINSIVGQMEASSFEFYLTGSRFFGGYSANSDWDYFVKDTAAVRLFLSDLGFIQDENPMVCYDDQTVVEVWQHNDIHIQLIVDVEWKSKTQEFLSNSVAMRNIPKIARKYVWNLALNVMRNRLVEESRKDLVTKTFLSGR